MADKKIYIVPEKFLLDIILASYDIKQEEEKPEVAIEVLRVTSIFSVQLLAPDMNYDLRGKLENRCKEINNAIIKGEKLLGYAKDDKA